MRVGTIEKQFPCRTTTFDRSALNFSGQLIFSQDLSEDVLVDFDSSSQAFKKEVILVEFVPLNAS